MKKEYLDHVGNGPDAHLLACQIALKVSEAQQVQDLNIPPRPCVPKTDTHLRAMNSSSAITARLSFQRARKPRGRTAQKGGEIDTRVARLEDLVRQLKAQVESSKGSRPGDGNGQNDPTETGHSTWRDSSTLQTYVASEFWEALSLEANGIREILEELDEGDTTSDPSIASPGPVHDFSSSSGAILSSPLILNTDMASAQHLTDQMRRVLLPLFQTRVDSIIKILHWPSFLAAIASRDTASGNSVQSRPIHALECAVCYTALCTMSDLECENMLYCQRAPRLHQLKLAAEISFSKARLLEMPDVTTLQAFFIYLVGLRCATTFASAWTLLSVAVRLASALGLGSEDPAKYSVFKLEIRRRLWLAIGVMDTQLSLDRGTPPLLSGSDFTSFPATINDSDLYPTCATLSPTETFSDMSFSAMAQQAMICQKRLYEVGSESQDPWSRWKDKLATISLFENYINTNLSHINNSSTSLEQFTKAVATGSLANIQLTLRRPPYRLQHGTSPVPPWDEFDIVKATTDILEQSINTRARIEFAPWQWFAWVKWYVLAVLLAELCGPGQGPEIDHSYLVAQRTFANYAQTIADSESGMLWRPIVKLMRRVERLRGTAVRGMPGQCSLSTEASEVNGFEFTALAGSDINATQNGTAIDLDLPHRNSAKQNPVTYPMMAIANSQQAIMDGNFEEDLSWVNWDAFLEDMNNSSNMD
ncbi:hypothetical protein LZ554_001164 [Drepanopeziza brunnea f. sp. 'monogermtubi']|nr:hypothetical protein LZ554_001164 [Drepanopeziza brunnea f. sp. 'monogermtubi']